MNILPADFFELDYAIAWLRGMAASNRLPDDLCAASRDGAILTLSQAVVDGKLTPFLACPEGEIVSVGNWALWRTDAGLDVFMTGRYLLAPSGVSLEQTERGKWRGKEAVALLVFQKANFLRAFGFEEVDPAAETGSSFRIASFPPNNLLPPRAKQMVLYREGQTADLELPAPAAPPPPHAAQFEKDAPTASLPPDPESAVVEPGLAAAFRTGIRSERPTRHEDDLICCGGSPEHTAGVVPRPPELIEATAVQCTSVEQIPEDVRRKTSLPVQLVRRRKRPGRRAKYGWAPVITGLGAKLSADGLPIPGDGGQAALELWVAAQFPVDSQPAESVIRAKVAEVIEVHRHALGMSLTSK